MKKIAESEVALQKIAPDEGRLVAVDLERRYAERTREVEAVRAEMEAFAYSISHDLRAPLVHIGGFVDLLLNHAGPGLDDKSRHYLRTIAASTYRMGRMLDDLLALTRVNEAELHRVSLDLEALVRDVVEELQPLTEGRQIQWSIGPLPTVDADPTLLRDVLMQLGSNAVKFTQPTAEARIGITARRGDGETIVSIHDNGVGFDMKHQDKLFGVFQRLHAASEFEGSGVGLARVRRIVQRHGGRTWGEGVPGGGAAFHFSLPDRQSSSP